VKDGASLKALIEREKRELHLRTDLPTGTHAMWILLLAAAPRASTVQRREGDRRSAAGRWCEHARGNMDGSASVSRGTTALSSTRSASHANTTQDI